MNKLTVIIILIFGTLIGMYLPTFSPAIYADQVCRAHNTLHGNVGTTGDPRCK